LKPTFKKVILTLFKDGNTYYIPVHMFQANSSNHIIIKNKICRCNRVMIWRHSNFIHESRPLILYITHIVLLKGLRSCFFTWRGWKYFFNINASFDVGLTQSFVCEISDYLLTSIYENNYSNDKRIALQWFALESVKE
jgi:hypothetical protein